MLMDYRSTTRLVLEKVITPTALILVDDDVVKVYLNADVELSKEAAEDNVEAIWHLIEGRKVFHLVVPESSTHVTMGVEEYGDARFEAIKKGEAIVVKTLAHRILAKGIVQARRGKYPVSIFNTETKAIAWFDSLRESSD
jgi:ribosomal protein S6